MNSKWEYGNYAEKYDMTGEIKIGKGVVKVHDIFDPLPSFMRTADVLFSDPPYNKSALSSYYTKANLKKRGDFNDFYFRFLECVSIIEPWLVCLEVGMAQTGMWKAGLKNLGYFNQVVKESYYYGNKNNKCNIIFSTKEDREIPDALLQMPFMDEEKVIEYICNNVKFDCIGDLCMGKGLVGFYANKASKRFVGTELNVNRLAVCVERVTTGERGKIN